MKLANFLSESTSLVLSISTGTGLKCNNKTIYVSV